jgi:hypothetical protein
MVLTSFNPSRSINNFTISISAKDKMCLLNGEVSGMVEAQIDFGKIEEENIYGDWITTSIPLQTVIRNIVHIYGKEPLHNIIINDLGTYGLELLEYRYDEPIFLLRKQDYESTYECAIFDRSVIVDQKTRLLSQLEDNYFDALVGDFNMSNQGQLLNIDSGNYYAAKIKYGDTAGYRMTDLVYAGDLIANVGDSLTSILDKIKNMLVEFEYFYDIDGRFIF